MRVLLIAVGAGLLVGCNAASTTPGRGADELALAEKAKAAIIALARSDRNIFFRLEPDRFQSVRVKKGDEPHEYFIGAFTVNVEKRLYWADVGDMKHHWFYHGTFAVDQDGRWTANRPDDVKEAWAPPGAEPAARP